MRSRPTKARIEPIAEQVAQAEQGAIGVHVAATFARNPTVAEPFFMLLRTLAQDTMTPRRQRELVILRTGWNCKSEYEFAQHRLRGLQAGLGEVEIDAVTSELAKHSWGDEDLVLLRMADDLCKDFCVSDTVWSELVAHWSTSEIMEFVFLSAFYIATASALNTFGVELEPGVRGWPTLGI